GVDPHAHLMAQVPLATAAAAQGGTTTALSFTNPDPGEADIDALLARRAELGIMCSPSRLLELMTEARKHDLLVQVHCENGPMIETLVAEAVHAGRRG